MSLYSSDLQAKIEQYALSHAKRIVGESVKAETPNALVSGRCDREHSHTWDCLRESLTDRADTIVYPHGCDDRIHSMTFSTRSNGIRPESDPIARANWQDYE